MELGDGSDTDDTGDLVALRSVACAFLTWRSQNPCQADSRQPAVT